MDLHAAESLVTGYESLIPSLTLPDPDDRHVLAAAIIGHADVIVTRNLRDFPAEILDRYEIEAQHPDEFLRHAIDLAPTRVIEAVRAQQASLTRPPFSMAELLALFERIGLAETVAELQRMMEVGVRVAAEQKTDISRAQSVEGKNPDRPSKRERIR
jgi:hypothetical protein